MTRLVTMFGVGDVYLICALARAFEAEHRTAVTIVCRAAHLPIPGMFGLAVEANDAEVARAEGDRELQRTWPNDGDTIYCHPSFVRTPARLDQLTLKSTVSQADMYRAMLRLSPWTELARPTWPPPEPAYQGATLMIPWAKSWPNANRAFWAEVESRLRARGENVAVCDPIWPLYRLLAIAAAAKWCIGAQCGVMSIIAENLPCRKTFAVTELLERELHGLQYVLPYGDPEKFAGTANHGWGVVLVPPHPRWQPAVEAICG